MKTRFLLIFLILALTTVILTLPNLKARIIQSLSVSECDVPTQYKLGALDSRFGLSSEEARSDMTAATDIWSTTYGKTLFSSSSSAQLTVNFVYDERSALNVRIDALQNQVNKNDITLDKQITAYQVDVKTFEQKMADFNAEVDQSNRSGGASGDVYNGFITKQNELNSEGTALNTRAKQLNLATHDYNSQVKNLNQNVNQFNQEIAIKPEEGVYSSGDNTITIYFASNHQELIHTLAHEFGHALGMQHTKDSHSIMYPGTTSFLTPTSEDKQQLSYVCRTQFLPNLWMQRLTVSLHSLLSVN